MCSRITNLVEREAPVWIELYPDLGSESIAGLEGQKRITCPQMNLETILSILDVAERLFGDA